MNFLGLLLFLVVVGATLTSATLDEACSISVGGNSYTFRYLPVGPRRVFLSPGTLDYLDIALSPCESSPALSFGCGGGYAGVARNDTSCSKSFTQVRAMRVDASYERYVERVFVTNNNNDNSSLTLRVHCDPSASETDLFANTTILSVFNNFTHEAYLIQFYAKTVCPSKLTEEPTATEHVSTTASPPDNETVIDCDIISGNDTFSFKYLPEGLFEAPLPDNQTINVVLSACSGSNALGFGCKEGYAGVTDGNNTCEAVFSNVTSTSIGDNFIERRYSSELGESEFALRLYCDPNADHPFANSSHIARRSTKYVEISLYSKTACPNYAPPEDDDDDDSNTLKTGTIVGIVIGVVGVVVLGAVIYQWRAKAEEEKSLQYSQLAN